MPRSKAAFALKKDLLAREMVKAMDETVYNRAVLKGMIDAKSKETIAEELHISPQAVANIQRRLVHEYKANFTTEVGFWVELIIARYNKMLEMLFPLAMRGERQAIAFVIEILEAQRKLIGADASDRQRQETVDSYKKKVQGELTIAVYDTYKQMIQAVRPSDPVEGALIGEVINGHGESVPLLPDGEDDAEEDESQEEIYNDEDP